MLDYKHIAKFRLILSFGAGEFKKLDEAYHQKNPS